MSESRRAFLNRIAKGAVYAAPVMASLAAPERLLGQGQSQNSKKGGMGKGMMMPRGMAIAEPGGIGTLRPPPASSPGPTEPSSPLAPRFPLRSGNREE